MLDCIEEFERLEAEMAGGNLTDNEAYPGARSEFIQNCLDDIEREE